MRRAQSMGINIVIVAAIALLILIIIVVLVSQSGRQIYEGTQACEVQGGFCSSQPPSHGQSISGIECPDGQICYRVVPR